MDRLKRLKQQAQNIKQGGGGVAVVFLDDKTGKYRVNLTCWPLPTPQLADEYDTRDECIDAILAAARTATIICGSEDLEDYPPGENAFTLKDKGLLSVTPGGPAIYHKSDH